MNRLEDIDKIQIAIRLDEGNSAEAIASEFAISVAQVRKLSREFGYASPRKNTRRLNEEEKLLVLERFQQGEEISWLAERFEVSEKVIRNLLKKNGLGLNPAAELDQSVKEEVRQLAAENESLDEIAEAYHLTLADLYQVLEEKYEDYKHLDVGALGFIFESLRDNPDMNAHQIVLKATHKGLEMSEKAVESYRNRLKRLSAI